MEGLASSADNDAGSQIFIATYSEEERYKKRVPTNLIKNSIVKTEHLTENTMLTRWL